MSCKICGRDDCSGSCQPAEEAAVSKESPTEEARRKRLERGDTLPDVEDDDDLEDLQAEND